MAPASLKTRPQAAASRLRRAMLVARDNLLNMMPLTRASKTVGRNGAGRSSTRARPVPASRCERVSPGDPEVLALMPLHGGEDAGHLCPGATLRVAREEDLQLRRLAPFQPGHGDPRRQQRPPARSKGPCISRRPTGGHLSPGGVEGPGAVRSRRSSWSSRRGAGSPCPPSRRLSGVFPLRL